MKQPLPVVTTNLAHWGWEEHQYFGHEVFGELIGEETFTGLSALAVLGRRLSPECCALLDDTAVALTLADPRIWPLKLTRLVASYGGIIPAAAAGLMIQEGARIGPWTTLQAATLLGQFKDAIDGRWDDPERVHAVVHAYLDEHSFVWGFGTPFRPRDERLVALVERVRFHERDTLPHWRTMQVVSEVVRDQRKTEPNVGLAVAALLLDMGLSDREIGPLTTTLMQHMFFANAVEGARQAPDFLRELPPEHLRYTGKAARKSPRALERT